LNLILIILYLGLLWLVFSRIPFYKNSGIDKKWFAIILLSKFLAGLAYNWIQKNYHHVGDTFAFFEAGQELASLLWTDPVVWLKLTFGPSGIKVPDKLLDTVDRLDFWTDASAYMMVRINGLFALLSRGSHAVMLAIWQIIPITGLVAIYKVVKDIFPDKADILKYALVFFPSLLFWSAGIHKEAVVLLCLGVLIYNVHFIKEIGLIRSIFIIIIFATVLLILRDYIFATFAPALLAYGLIKYNWIKKLGPVLFFSLFFVSIFTLLALISFIDPRLNLFMYIAESQQFFLEHIKGNSNYSIVPIDGSIGNMIRNAPRAFFTALFNPDILDIESDNIILRVLSVAENMMLIAFIVWCFFRNKIKSIEQKNFLCLALFFSIGLLVLLGLVVNNLGALYRYKSNLLPLLIPALVGISLLSDRISKSSITNKS